MEGIWPNARLKGTLFQPGLRLGVPGDYPTFRGCKQEDEAVNTLFRKIPEPFSCLLSWFPSKPTNHLPFKGESSPPPLTSPKAAGLMSALIFSCHLRGSFVPAYFINTDRILKTPRNENTLCFSKQPEMAQEEQ